MTLRSSPCGPKVRSRRWSAIACDRAGWPFSSGGRRRTFGSPHSPREYQTGRVLDGAGQVELAAWLYLRTALSL